MSGEKSEILAPVILSPTGLVSWYASDGTPVAQFASWVAIVSGRQPLLKSSLHNNQAPMFNFMPGSDFVYNIPMASLMDKIREVACPGQYRFRVDDELGCTCVPGIAVMAPCLKECSVQIECVNGRLLDSTGEMELSGEVVLLHRGHEIIDPSALPDLFAIEPLLVD
jgi:flavin reductase (DIM6/NTAB) family NADH-FMN oxidoreductase RutF